MFQSPTGFATTSWTPDREQSTPLIGLEQTGDGTRITKPASKTTDPVQSQGTGSIAAASESLASGLHCWSIRIDDNVSNDIVCGLCAPPNDERDSADHATNVSSEQYFYQHRNRDQPFAIESPNGYFYPFKYTEAEPGEGQQLPTGSTVTFMLDLRGPKGEGTLDIFIDQSDTPVITMRHLPPGLKRFVSIGVGDIVTCLTTPEKTILALVNVKQRDTQYRLRLRLQG